MALIQDFSKTPKAGFSASGMVNEESRGSWGRREAGGKFKTELGLSLKQSVLEERGLIPMLTSTTLRLATGAASGQGKPLISPPASPAPSAPPAFPVSEDQGDTPFSRPESTVADRSGNQSISEDIPEATTDRCLNGRVTGNEISHASPKAGGSETQPTQTTAVNPALVAPQLEHLEPGALVGSLLVPGWTYRVVEVRPNGQLNCTRLLSSGESFNVDLDINGVYLVEKAAYVAPEPEPEPELLANAPINERHSQAPQSESPEEEPTAAQLEEPMTPEKLAEFIRTAWSWEEIEAITASNEQYKKAAWSLLTQKEKDQVLVLKLESQQKEKPTPEPEPLEHR